MVKVLKLDHFLQMIPFGWYHTNFYSPVDDNKDYEETKSFSYGF